MPKSSTTGRSGAGSGKHRGGNGHTVSLRRSDNSAAETSAVEDAIMRKIIAPSPHGTRASVERGDAHGTAVDSLVADLPFSEQLSRKVLSSLQVLNDSLDVVRESVMKIDNLATAPMRSPQPSPTSSRAPPSTPSGSQTAADLFSPLTSQILNRSLLRGDTPSPVPPLSPLLASLSSVASQTSPLVAGPLADDKRPAPSAWESMLRQLMQSGAIAIEDLGADEATALRELAGDDAVIACLQERERRQQTRASTLPDSPPDTAAPELFSPTHLPTRSSASGMGQSLGDEQPDMATKSVYETPPGVIIDGDAEEEGDQVPEHGLLPAHDSLCSQDLFTENGGADSGGDSPLADGVDSGRDSPPPHDADSLGEPDGLEPHHEGGADYGNVEAKASHPPDEDPNDEELGYSGTSVPSDVFDGIVIHGVDSVPDLSLRAFAAPIPDSPVGASTRPALTPVPEPKSATTATPTVMSGNDELADELALAQAEGMPQPASFEFFDLRVTYPPNKTGLGSSSEFIPEMGSLIAGRYQVRDFMGSAAFSTAYACYDRETDADVCLKVVKNDKQIFDQSLDEIKVLLHLNQAGDCDTANVLNMYDYFYFEEHLFIVTELLKDQLYEFQKYLSDNNEEPYFTVPRLQRLAEQCLQALDFIHRQGIIHCDLKPENILIKSYSKCQVKIIDFGSSCFTTDTITSYIQSRSYRAPEVVLGCECGTKIDMWSLGCILVELYTGHVLFKNDSVQTMLARMMGLRGDFPEHMLTTGKDVPNYFTPDGVVYEVLDDGDSVFLFKPLKATIKSKLDDCSDKAFVDFVDWLLTVDPAQRPSAADALKHEFFTQEYDFTPYVLPA